MAISKPTKNVFTILDKGTTGTVNYVFNLPQDTTAIVARVYASGTFTGTSPTCDVYIQTSDDGGTTWRDCAHAAQMTAIGTIANAQFIPIPSVGSGVARNAATAYVGSVQASTLAAARISGLPLLSTQARISIQYGGTVGTNNGIQVDVFASGQDSAI